MRSVLRFVLALLKIAKKGNAWCSLTCNESTARLRESLRWFTLLKSVGRVPSGSLSHEVAGSTERVTFWDTRSEHVIQEYIWALVSMSGYSDTVVRCFGISQSRLTGRISSGVLPEASGFSHGCVNHFMHLPPIVLNSHRKMSLRHEVDNQSGCKHASASLQFQVRQNVFGCFVVWGRLETRLWKHFVTAYSKIADGHCGCFDAWGEYSSRWCGHFGANIAEDCEKNVFGCSNTWGGCSPKCATHFVQSWSKIA